MTSYITTTEAQTYFDDRLNTGAWDTASSDDRGISLAHATRIIDRLAFKWTKTSSAQTLSFPRGGSSTIPDGIKNACAEIAISLLDGAKPELDFEALNILSQTQGQVKSVYKGSEFAHITAGVPSVIAWSYLLPYLRDPNAFVLRRT